MFHDNRGPELFRNTNPLQIFSRGFSVWRSSISNVHGSFDSEFDWTKGCITGRDHFARAGCFQPRSLNDYLTKQPTNQPTNQSTNQPNPERPINVYDMFVRKPYQFQIFAFKRSELKLLAPRKIETLIFHQGRGVVPVD